jgi:LPXTG-motif cell wall-anchored protein
MESIETALIWLIVIGLAIMAGGLIWQRIQKNKQD